VEKLGAEFTKGLPEDADARLREAEQAVGIDPGGWSMAGQPLFHPTPEILAQSTKLDAELEAAMRSDNPDAVRAVTARMAQALEAQAGVPDGRRPGIKAAPVTMNQAEATRLFLDALASEKKAIEQLTSGKTLPDQMVRFYAYLLGGTSAIRPFVKTHDPARLPASMPFSSGVAGILTSFQQPAGTSPSQTCAARTSALAT